MTWTGTILTDAEFIFLGIDGYFANGQIFGITPPIQVSATPTQVVLRDPDWQGRITFNGTGLTMGTAPVAGGGTVPIFTGGTITSFTVEFNDARRAIWQLGTPEYINNIGGIAVYSAQVAATEFEVNLATVGTIFTGGIPAADLGTAVAASFAASNFAALNTYLDQFARNLSGDNNDNGLVGDAQNDTLLGQGGVDRIEGDGGNDLIDGGANDDGFLIGGAGNDTVRGGSGNDASIFGDNVDGTGTGNDLLEGGPGNDRLNGGGGNDFLDGGTGDDFMDGGEGSDTMDGGAGADTYTGGIVSNPGDIDVASYVSSPIGLTIDLNISVGNPGYSATGDAFGDTYFGIEYLLGSLFDDVIQGQSFNGDFKTLDGNAGDDSIFGNAGTDTLIGGKGDDFLDGGSGAGPETDVALYQTAENDIAFIPGSGGFFAISAFEGVDFLTNIEALIMNGVLKGVGALTVDPRSLVVSPGGTNTQTLTNVGEIYFGSNDVDNIRAEGGADILIGFGGSDSLTGGTDGDILFGGDGNDTLDGGPGNDTMTGGSGNDTFIKRPGQSADVITDFEQGATAATGDKIDLTNTNLSYNQIGFTPGIDGLLVTVGADTILLDDSPLQALAPTDFILPLQTLNVDGAGVPVRPYDPSQDFGFSFVSGTQNAVTLSGNAWKALQVNAAVTANTVLRFDFTSADLGEIAAIGFDTNTAFGGSIAEFGNFFQLGGTEVRPEMAATGLYNGSGQTQQIEIVLNGDVAPGTYQNLVLVMDDDPGSVSPGSGTGTFANIELFERAPLIFNGADRRIEAYDPVQDSGSATVSADRSAVTLTGNAWKRFDLGYTLTRDTVLSFDFTSADLGEIAAIGFDSNGAFAGSTVEFPQFFQLGGTELRPNMAAQGLYTGNGQTQRIEIKVGELLPQGLDLSTLTQLVMVMDDDPGSASPGSGTGTFANITLSEGPSLLVDGAFEAVSGYDPVQDAGTATVSGDQRAVTLAGNAWKRIDGPFTLGADTKLAVEVTSADTGEILGIGFDTNAQFQPSDLGNIFQLGGSELRGDTIADFRTYSAGDGTKQFILPVGQFTPGTFQNMVLVADDDGIFGNQQVSGQVTFANIRLFEGDAVRISEGIVGLQTYGQGQDAGTANVSADLTSVTLTGNAWKRLSFDTPLTRDTVLSFDFTSSDLGEIAAIGFDSDATFAGSAVEFPQFFQLGGSEIRPNMAAQGLYTGNGQTQRIEIALGDVLPQTVDLSKLDELVLVMDDDPGSVSPGSGTGTFANITLEERLPLRVDGSLTRVQSYDPVQDEGSATVSADQDSVTLSDNAWKRLEGPHTVTTNTWLSFDLTSPDTGEILGIGFDKTDRFSVNDLAQIFQLGGADQRIETQNGFRTYQSGDGTTHFDIPLLGAIAPGSYKNIVLVADDDGVQTNGDATATFSKITLSEGPPVFVGSEIEAVLPHAVQAIGRQDFGTATPGGEGREITLAGNAWKGIDVNLDITPGTFLSFEFASSDLGEISAIGFDNNTTFGAADLGRLWQLGGSDQRSEAEGQLNYSGNGAFQSFEIDLAASSLSGLQQRLVLVADDDGVGDGMITGTGTFRDIEFLKTPTSVNVVSHGGGQDAGRVFETAEGGTLKLDQNAWKAILPGQALEVDANTRLQLRFRSDVEGEIQGIGFDSDSAVSQEFLFRLAGSQTTWGNGQAAGYQIGSGFELIDIAVGAEFQGTFDRIVLAMDSDNAAAGNPGDAYFENIVLTGLGAADETLVIL